jgi:subtilisin family serine protease
VKKWILALGIAAGLISGIGVIYATRAGISTPSEQVVVSGRVEDYTNHQVLTRSKDGEIGLVSYNSDEELEQGLNELARDEKIELIQPNYSYESCGDIASDTFVSNQWWLDNDGTFVSKKVNNQSITAVAGVDINIQSAWKTYGQGGRDVVVALLDNGVDMDHVDLQGSFWTNPDEIPGNGVDDDGNGYIDDVYGWNFCDQNNKVAVGKGDSAHGTHLAGIISAVRDNSAGVAGIAPNSHVKIMVLKVLNNQGKGDTSAIIHAIQYAQANGASICNLSLYSESSDPALLKAMSESSMLFVTAAGNGGKDLSEAPLYPASYHLDNQIVVSGITCDGAQYYQSSYGAQTVDLAAPGHMILSTTVGNTYKYMTGTSMSSAMVTGAAAMVYSYYEDLPLQQVKNVLIRSARKIPALQDKNVAGGILDLGAALSYGKTYTGG